MTVASAVNRVDYIGNASTATFAYTFKIFLTSDLQVTQTNTSSGVETLLVLTTDYTVTGAGESSGGTVVLVAGNLATGQSLAIRRVLPLTQPTDIRNQGDFFAEVHENEFDRLVMQDQQQQDEIDRSVKIPESVSASSFDTTLPTGIAESAGRAILVNATGDGFTLSAAASAGLDSIPFRDVISLSSDVTLVEANRNLVYAVDTSGGMVTITLPEIAGLSLASPFSIVIKKITSDANIVMIETDSGGDTLDSVPPSGQMELGVLDAGVILIPDTDETPDTWTRLLIGATGSGSGASTIIWTPGDATPLEENVGGMALLDYDSQSAQEIFAVLKVPDSFVLGNQISLQNSLYATSVTSGNVLIKAETALVVPTANNLESLFASYPNRHTSQNVEVTANGTTNRISNIGTIDLTDITGSINSQSVGRGHLLLIRLYRDISGETTSAAADVRVLRNSFEVNFS